MNLYLLRHGIAESRSASGRDIDRNLTPEGIAKLRGVLAQARELGVAPQWIVASPYVRAQQTARIAAEVLGCEEPILASTRLTPESSPEELWQEVRELQAANEIDAGPLLLVAHNPLLSEAAPWLAGESRVIIEFRPASLIGLSFETVGPAPEGRVHLKLHAD